MSDWPLLSLIIWLPILGGVYVMLTGRENAAIARKVGLGISLVTFIISLLLWVNFDSALSSMQLQENLQWIGAFNVYYHLGVDGISMPLIILTAFSTVLVIIAGWEVIQKKPEQYIAAFLVMEGMMIGVFCALDAFLFYVFWEGMLIPMFLVIGIWGGANRVYATIKFFLYTFLGSVLMLVALIYLRVKVGSFELSAFHQAELNLTEQIFIFLAFLIAFAVKVPMWPVHTWLPDAHVEAPTGGSVILAAIMLKIGGYGFLRFSLPIAPDASRELDWLLIAMSLIGVVYIGFVALVQTDMKKLIAYSSIAHMGFVTLGFFIMFSLLMPDKTIDIQKAIIGLEGSMVQMISHGFISAALFLAVGVMYDRIHSREIADYGGVAHSMPVFAAFTVFFAMANSGLPGTSGFVGEFMVIMASFGANFWYAFLAATTLILGAAYSLWMVKRVLYGEIVHEHVKTMKDLNQRELFVMSALAIPVLVFGVWPDPIVDVMHATLEHLLQHISNKLTYS